MKLHIKNNNLYYYNYPIFNGELSLLLMLILIIIIYRFNDYLKYLGTIPVVIVILGNMDAYAKGEKYNLKALAIVGGLLVHLPGLYPLLNVKKYMRPNIVNLLLNLLAILIILFLPYWPYEVSRKIFLLTLVAVYIINFMYFYYLDLHLD